MRKIKLFLSIVLSIFFLASCSLNSTQRPANPGNDVIEPGEEGYTVTVKDFETKELIISLTKKSTNIIRFADLKLNEIEGYTITLVDEVGNPTEIEDIKHTCTLYVKYAPNTYKLSFIEQGSRVETLKVTYNENVSPIEATLIPTGYEFLGWSEKKDEYVPYTFDKMPAHNVEVYAHYQLKEYAITLETKIAALEGLVNISKYHYNDRLNNFVPLELQEAIKALPKYTLVGWYIDEALTIPFENISMPACDLTLYAKWEYDGLSFVDGNNIIGIGSGSIGDPIITPTPVEKEGFQFIGWYYDEEFTNEVKPGDLITEGLQNIYAYYKPLNNVEYRVEYYLQTFGVSYTLTKTDKFSGTTGTLVNADVLAFEGFTFDQSNSNNLLQANILANGSLTLKVYYSRNAYNVVYNTYDGEYATYENIKYGDAVLKPANPSRVGYTFAGWDQEVPTLMPNNDVVLNALWTANTNTAYKVEHYIEKLDGTYELKETENLTGTTDTNAVAVSKLYSGFTFNASHALNLLEGNIEADGSRVLKVYYLRNSYTLTINVDGVENNVSYKYEEAVALPTTPTKVGYTFSTWSPEVPSTMPANNVKVVAEWQVNEYTLTINVDGVKTEVVYEYGETVEAPTDPSKDGHTFTGWTPEVPSTMPANNVEVVAEWKVNQYTITIKYDNETEDKVITQDYDSVIEIVPDPSKTGHTFTGWITDTGVAAVVPSVMPAKDLVLHATWSINEYTITIKYDNETEDKVITQNYNTNIETIENPTKVGHTFTGWDQEIPSKMPAQNLTINATWKVNQYTITIKYDNDSEDKVITQDYDSVIEIVPDPSKTGHTFTGWVTDTGVATVVPSVMPAKDLELTATWSINEYTITIKYDNETEDKVITQDYNTNIETIENPTKVGHTFTGWDQEIPSKMPAQNLTINATWSINEYTLTINVDGVKTEVVYEYGETVDVPTDPSKVGYTFTGWTPEVPSTMPANNVEVVAEWELTEYTLSFDLNGGNSHDISSDIIKTIALSTYDNKGSASGIYFADANITPNNSLRWQYKLILEYYPEYDAYKVVAVDAAKLSTNNAAAAVGATWTHVIVSASTDVSTYAQVGEFIRLSQVVSVGSTNFSATTHSATELFPNVKYTMNDSLSLGTPTRQYYTFAGWFNGETQYDSIPVGTTENMTLVANWIVNKYTITTNVDGVKTEIEFDYNSEISIANPEKHGYTFIGWSPELPTNMPANDFEVVAEWELTEYTLSFDLNGGNSHDISSDIIKTIALSTYDNKGSASGIYFADTNVTPNNSLRWQYKLILEYYPEYDAYKVVAVDAAKLSTNNAAAAVGATWTHVIASASTDVSTYAQVGEFIRLSQVVSVGSTNFSATTHSATELFPSVKYTMNDSLSLGTPTRQYYTFAGWFNGETQYDSIPVGTTGNMTLVAKWNINEYSITYNLAGGQIKAYSSFAEIAADLLADYNAFSGRGWTVESIPSSNNWIADFADFYYSEEYHAKWSWLVDYLLVNVTQSNKEAIEALKLFDNATDYEAANTTVYPYVIGYEFRAIMMMASFSKNSNFVTADYSNEAIQQQVWNYVATNKYTPAYETFPLFEPTKVGYTFLGWYDEEDQLVTEITKGTAGNIVLTAKWDANEYTVTVDVDGNKHTYTFDCDAEIIIPAPTKEGYEFTGWTPSLPLTMPANNLEVAARWTIKQFTITIVYDNGNENTVITQDYNSAIEAVADPTKTGHTFAGWSQAIPSTMPAEDLTIRANWTANKYTITLVYDNGNENTVITQDYNSTIEPVTDPTKTGHTFAGWSQAIPSTMPAEDLTIRANWTVNKYTITFVVNGFETNKEFEYGALITDEEIDKDTNAPYGYEFKEWNPVLDETMPANDLEVVAVWTEKIIKFDGSIDFSSTTQRTEFSTSSQTWVGDNGLVFINNKAESTTNVADYAPVRLYKSSSIEISFSKTITRIEFVCTSNSYANALKNSIVGENVIVDGTKVIVELNNTSNSFVVSALSAQVRLSALTVYYENSFFNEKLQEDKVNLSNTQVVDSGNTITLPSGTLSNGTVIGEWTATPSGFIDLETLVATATENTDVVLTTTLTNGPATETFSITVTIVCTPIHEHIVCDICGLCLDAECDGEEAEKCQGHLPEPTPTDKTVAELLQIDNSLNLKASYNVTGTVSAFGSKLDVTDASADKFGNFILEADGQKIIVYGSTANRDNLVWNNISNAFEFKTSYDFLENELTSTIAVGSIVELLVVRTDYNGTPQLKAIVLSVDNSALSKIPEPEVTNKTVEELLAIESSLEMKESYNVIGTVLGFGTSLTSPSTTPVKFGNLILEANGSKIIVYGATATASALVWNEYSGLYTFTNPQDFLTNELTSTIVVGSVVELVVVRTSYEGTPQLNAIVVSVDNSSIPTHEHVACPTCGLCTAEDCDGLDTEKCAGHVVEPVEEVLNVTKVTEVSQLTDGAQIIISYLDANIMGAQDGTKRVRVEASIVDGKVAKEGLQVITLVKSGDNWLLKVSETEYLKYTGSSNQVHTGTETDETAQWTISINEGVLTIVNVAEKTRYLQYNSNSGQERFCCYKGTQKNPDIYIVNNVTSEIHLHTVCTTCGLCVSEDCTGEESVKCQGHVAVEESVYNVTEVTDLSQLSNGSQIILYYDGKVMGAQGNGIRDIVTATISETNTIPQNGIQVVTLEAVGDGSWFLKVSDTEYLYAINDNKVYTGTEKTDAYKWNIVIESGQIKIQNVSYGERYLQYNTSSPRFACYKGTQKNPSIYLLTA